MTEQDLPTQEKPVKSPCVSICALNEEDICVGCFRTGMEISRWGGSSNEERRRVLALAVERSKKSNPFL
ncbi:DUF1289 domain-containing protein [Pseudomaricurvus sp. HS19]|uniref:DUF1289 domain-containing protein n=1 Tax=Pseudomaricurvus sp. HS19 TaxID=2692626 RepID=UPI00136A443D|nr:DUF1289 domain-containing protein [Pseudomaricurvus sp. HS19]MYM61939.1 DUF1289 domain-containing protein [Pseudomaricurvus sp. HS19]